MKAGTAGSAMEQARSKQVVVVLQAKGNTSKTGLAGPEVEHAEVKATFAGREAERAEVNAGVSGFEAE